MPDPDFEQHLRLPFWLPWLNWIYPKTIIATSITITVLYFVFVSAAAYGIYHFDANTKLDTAVERIFPYPAGEANGQLIPLSRVRLQVAALTIHNAKSGQSASRQETEQIVTRQIADRLLYQQALADHKIVVSQANIDTQMQSIAKSLGGQEKLVAFLNDQYGSSMTLQRFQDWIVGDSLQEAAVQQQLLVRSTVSHILISIPAGSTNAQIESARQKALGIKAKITTTAQFTDIAKQYSDDVASRDAGGTLGTTVRGGASAYGADFENVAFSLPINQVSDPVRSTYGWHLIIVTARTGSINQSLADYTKTLRVQYHEKIFLKTS